MEQKYLLKSQCIFRESIRNLDEWTIIIFITDHMQFWEVSTVDSVYAFKDWPAIRTIVGSTWLVHGIAEIVLHEGIFGTLNIHTYRIL